MSRLRTTSARSLAIGALVVGLVTGSLLTSVAVASHQFPDVGNSNTFHGDIDWLATQGITGGYGDGTFRPGSAVTRQSMAAFLNRYNGRYTLAESQLDPGAGVSFQHTASCGLNQRPLGGGGSTSETTLAIIASVPDGSGWTVSWRNIPGTSIDPTLLSVWAQCGPAL